MEDVNTNRKNGRTIVDLQFVKMENVGRVASLYMVRVREKFIFEMSQR